MCCFSGPVHVEGTQIFARTDRWGWQGIVYEMTYESQEPVAMVLPVPVAPDDSGFPLRFLDYSDNKGFFRQLAKGFEVPVLSKSPQTRAAAAALPVQRVGAFDASFVPSLRDFARLDARFRIDDDVWRALPRYQQWGFAVFQLAAAGHAQAHPMAFAFKTLEPKRVFFPTLHIHDGTAPTDARFDHMLYLQTSQPPPTTWDRSDELAGAFVDVEHTQKLVRRSAPMYRMGLKGMRRNEDTWADAA